MVCIERKKITGKRESTKRSNAIIPSLSTLNSSFIAPRSSITEYNFFPIASSFYTRATRSSVGSYVTTTKSSLCERTCLGVLSRRRPIAARNTRRRVSSIRSIGIVSKVRNSTRLMKIYRFAAFSRRALSAMFFST